MVIFIIIRDISDVQRKLRFSSEIPKISNASVSSLNAMFFQHLPAHYYAVFSTVSRYFFSDEFGHTPLP
jgi:hypothetical protein